MALISKLAFLALPALAGCGALSQAFSQGEVKVQKGKAPASYKGPALNFKNAQRRADDFYDANKFFSLAGVRTPYLDTIPLTHAHYKNGFLDLLKDGNRKLSKAEIESARDAVQAFIKHDTRCDLKQIRSQLSGVPESKWAEVVAKNIFETSQDALAYAGISNPSKELTQYSFGMACTSFTYREGNGIYDYQRGMNIALKIKRWLTSSEWMKDPRGVCTEFTKASTDFVRAGAASISELSDLESASSTGHVVGSVDPVKLASHSVLSFRINRKFVFISDGAISSNAPISAGELAVVSTQIVTLLNAAERKFFSMEYVGGDRPGKFLDLNNGNSKYQPANLSKLSREEAIFRRKNKLNVSSDFKSWHQSNPQILPRLQSLLSQYR